MKPTWKQWALFSFCAAAMIFGLGACYHVFAWLVFGYDNFWMAQMTAIGLVVALLLADFYEKRQRDKIGIPAFEIPEARACAFERIIASHGYQISAEAVDNDRVLSSFYIEGADKGRVRAAIFHKFIAMEGRRKTMIVLHIFPEGYRTKPSVHMLKELGNIIRQELDGVDV